LENRVKRGERVDESVGKFYGERGGGWGRKVGDGRGGGEGIGLKVNRRDRNGGLGNGNSIRSELKVK
jgi:hypothetical protein